MLKIDARLAELRAALETEADAEKRVTLSAQIAALESANALLDARKGKGNETDRGDPKKKPGNTDDDEDDGDGDEDEEDDDEACKNAKAKARKAKGKAKSADSEEKKAKAMAELFTARAEVQAAKAKKAAKKARGRADEEEEEEEDDEEAKAVLATLYQVTGGRRGQAAIGALAALVSKAGQYDALASDVAALKAQSAAREQASVIQTALAQRRITKPEAKSLEGKPQSYVAAYLDARPRALVQDEADLATPKDDLSAVAIPKGAQKMIDELVAKFPGADPKAYRAQLEQSAREATAKIGGRY
jgi:hypothetical protein